MTDDPFSVTPPPWVNNTVHALTFNCPKCQEPASKSEKVWINRRSPVIDADHRRKWQEFYLCECGQGWWAWSSDRRSDK